MEAVILERGQLANRQETSHARAPPAQFARRVQWASLSADWEEIRRLQ